MPPEIVGEKSGEAYLISVSEENGFVYDVETGERTTERLLGVFLKFGYWEESSGTPEILAAAMKAKEPTRKS